MNEIEKTKLEKLGNDLGEEFGKAIAGAIQNAEYLSDRQKALVAVDLMHELSALPGRLLELIFSSL